MKNMMIGMTLIFSLTWLTSCDQIERFEVKAEKINRYEVASLHLSRENRELKTKVSHLLDEIQTLKSEKNFLSIKLDKYEKKDAPTQSRNIASIGRLKPKNDLVKFDVYKWTPSQMLAMAEKEFEGKNFEKSAQFFTTFKERFPGHERVDDHFLFQAGVAAFETGKHPEWTLEHLESLVKAYPTSQYYRGAKLWMALTYLQLGQEQKFFNTVEEFRKKYRNTEEWKVLSPHYEKIVQKYKRN